MDWTKSIAANLAASKELYDYERQRYGQQGGMNPGQVQARQPDIIVQAPEVQQNPFAGMPAPTYNINNTYTSNYEAPAMQQPALPQINLPTFQAPQMQMPQLPQPQMPTFDPPPQAPQPQQQAPAPPKPEPQQQAPEPPKQEYHGNLGVDSGAFSQSWQQNWSKPTIKIPW